MGRVFPIVVAIALLVYAVIDCLQTDPAKIRLNRLAWLAIIILLPIIGPGLWIAFAKRPPSRPRATPPRRPLAPDDDPEFLRHLRDIDKRHEKMLDQWEADMRRRERELRRRRDEELRRHRDDTEDGS